VYACLFLCILENDLANVNPTWPHYYKRYIDDGCGIWEGLVISFKLWLEHYNSLSSTINIQWKISTYNIDFLDIFFNEGPCFSSTGILESLSKET
jgi:hypothetical protein